MMGPWAAMSQDNYPMTSCDIYFVDAPKFFGLVWTIISPMLNEVCSQGRMCKALRAVLCVCGMRDATPRRCPWVLSSLHALPHDAHTRERMQVKARAHPHAQGRRKELRESVR